MLSLSFPIRPSEPRNRQTFVRDEEPLIYVLFHMVSFQTKHVFYRIKPRESIDGERSKVFAVDGAVLKRERSSCRVSSSKSSPWPTIFIPFSFSVRPISVDFHPVERANLSFVLRRTSVLYYTFSAGFPVLLKHNHLYPVDYFSGQVSLKYY